MTSNDNKGKRKLAKDYKKRHKKSPAAYRRSKKAGMKPAMEYKKIPAGGAGTKKAGVVPALMAA